MDAFEVGDVLKVVGSLAQDVAIDLRNAELGRLATAMQIASLTLQASEQQPTGMTYDDIWQFLQAICATGSSSQHLRWLLPGAPTKQQAVITSKVKKSLKAYYVDSLRQPLPEDHFITRWVKRLEGLAQLETKSTSRHTPVDYPDHVNNVVYELLKPDSRCSCNGNPLLSSHPLRICLTPKHQRGNHVIFDLIFAANDTGVIQYWQQLRLLIPRSSAQARRARFIEQDLSVNDEKPNGSRINDLCSVIVDYIGPVYRCVRIHGQKFFLLDRPDEADSILQADDSVSLTTVLRQGRLTDKMKMILAWILAHSVWRFYKSSWIGTKWSTDTVHFMREEGNSTFSQINAGRPCLVVRFDHTADATCSEHFDASGRVLHRYPRILLLGKLLVDIGRDKNSWQNAWRTSQNVISQLNTDFMNAKLTLKDQKWPYMDFLQTTKNVYRQATVACIEHDFSDIQKGTSDIEYRRGQLYERIVYPLEDLMRTMQWQQQMQAIEPVDVIDEEDDEAVSMPNVVTPSAITLPTPNQLIAQNQNFDASKWFDRLLHTYRFIIPRVPVAVRSTRIKIAILDTGYDPKAIFFQDRDRNARLRAGRWCDFVDNQTLPIDTSGHGTKVLSVLMRSAPWADIFVARIARDDTNWAGTDVAVAKAIEVAVKVWNVDIISMSFGIPEDSYGKTTRQASRAIDQAVLDRQGRILFFAAAGNDSSNNNTMFPACHSSVISVHGTDAEGTFQRGMNPLRRHRELAVYGTVAVNIPCAGLCHQGEIFDSGTSLATPITAGTAATLLYYVLKLENGSEHRTRGKSLSLKNKEAMLSMFRKTCQLGEYQASENKYFLDPVKFYMQDEETQWSDVVTALRDK